VRRALVFGVPDPRWGHLVAAAIELDSGVDLSSLADPVAAALAPHKRPRLACAAPALPLTASGKLSRAGAAARHEAALRPFPPPKPVLR
jgi:O-succinylbenzoic acid--CoA ligase